MFQESLFLILKYGYIYHMSLEKKYHYIAFFDLDKTILSVNSANYLVKESRKRGTMSKQNYRRAIYYSILYKLNWRDATKIIHRMLLWLNGVSKIGLESMCREVYDSTLRNFIRPEIIKEFEMHRNNGAALVLLSSATSFVCNPVFKDLNMDDLVCSHIEDRNGKLTGRSRGKLVFGKEKRIRLLAYCKTENYDPENAWYYGDAFSDHHVLEAVGNPVCVDPDKRLKKMAIRKGWRVLIPE